MTVTNEMIYRELLALEQQLADAEKLMRETLDVAKATVRDAEMWRKKMDEYKRQHGFMN